MAVLTEPHKKEDADVRVTWYMDYVNQRVRLRALHRVKRKALGMEIDIPKKDVTTPASFMDALAGVMGCDHRRKQVSTTTDFGEVDRAIRDFIREVEDRWGIEWREMSIEQEYLG